MTRLHDCWLAMSVTGLFALPGLHAQGPKLELVVQTGHSDIMDCITCSDDGRRVVTGARDNTAILWDADTGIKYRPETSAAMIQLVMTHRMLRPLEKPA